MIQALPNRCNNILSRLQFRNTGIVTRDMRFQYHDMPCYYVEDVDKWSTPWGPGGTSSYSYLYETRDAPPRRLDTPDGMRSSVPLGGLGAGTIELRADGSLRDWNIFNNSPAGGGQKVHLDEALLGLRVKGQGNQSRAWILRTHPPAGLPAIAQIQYSGAFPVSRLRFADPELPIAVDLYAYCEFRIRDAQGSATPAVIFSLNLHNSSDSRVEASLMLNLPNHISGHYSSGAGLTLTRAGEDPVSGDMAIRIAGDNFPVSWSVAHDLRTLWEDFTDTGMFTTSAIRDASTEHGAVATSVKLGPGGSEMVTFVLSWYFPHRPHGSEIVGNFYTNLYTSADDVADRVMGRLPSTWDAIHKWQTLCFQNSLPEWLQDALVNSVATMYKTGMWFADGGWRQWESFSCPAVDPIHIHFYRALPYAWFFPSLQQNLLKAYAGAQTEEGYIREHLADSGHPDRPGGRQMGDGCTAFLLEVYQNYLWNADREFLDSFWPNARRAAQWQIHRSEKYGLPNNLNSTYDWWGFERKDLVSYNAFLHVAAMLAAERLAAIQGDNGFAEVCRANLEQSRRALRDHLWTGQYFRSWWMAHEEFPDALHADTLYGQLWAFILDLGWTTDPQSMRSHLAVESELNASQFGLKVMQRTGQDQDNRDNLVWQAGSIDWCSLNIYMGEDVQAGLREAQKVIQHWREKLCDQWDYRDLTTAWDGYPWCNSHYARQLMFWAIPLALSGQRYSAVEKKLSFEPKMSPPAKLPFFTPSASGILELYEDGKYKLTVLSGELELERLAVSQVTLAQQIRLKAGQSALVRSQQ